MLFRFFVIEEGVKYVFIKLVVPLTNECAFWFREMTDARNWWLYIGWIPRNLKISNSSRNWHFWLKITFMITRVNSRIFTNSPYFWISLFSWNGHFDNYCFRGKLKKSYIAWIRQNLEITLVIMNVIFNQKS